MSSPSDTAPRSPAPATDPVTVLVFKDNHAARTFQIPLGWINRLGAALAIVIFLTLATSLLALKYYRLSRQGSAAHAQDLERELTDLRSANAGLETQLKAARQGTGAALPANPSPQGATGGVSRNASAVGAGLFTALAPNSEGPLPAPSALPFSITAPKVSWRGNSLNIQFALQYTANDGGNQQGRIVLLARGPETLLGHPGGVLNLPGSATLLRPEQGEYFSVGRYREVQGAFSSANRSRIREVEILIFNTDNQLILRQSLPTEAGAAAEQDASEAESEEE